MVIIKREKLDLSYPEKPLCACGCGKHVTSYNSKYVQGHRAKQTDEQIRRANETRKRNGFVPWNKDMKMPKEFGEKVSRAKKGVKLNLSDEVRKKKSKLRRYLNLIDNPSKKPGAKKKLRKAYYDGITLNGIGKR